tara:strand:+ start:1113 stop:1355 length:243 start_codon:yes stop_codon:yes gene_type:complete
MEWRAALLTSSTTRVRSSSAHNRTLFIVVRGSANKYAGITNAMSVNRPMKLIRPSIAVDEIIAISIQILKKKQKFFLNII